MTERRLSLLSSALPAVQTAIEDSREVEFNKLAPLASLGHQRNSTLSNKSSISQAPLIPTHILAISSTKDSKPHSPRKSILIIPETQQRLIVTEREGELYGYGTLFTGNSIDTTSTVLLTRGKDVWNCIDETDSELTRAKSSMTDSSDLIARDGIFSLPSIAQSQSIESQQLAQGQIARKDFHDKCITEGQRLAMLTRDKLAEQRTLHLIDQVKPISVNLMGISGRTRVILPKVDTRQGMRIFVTLPRIVPVKVYKVREARVEHVPWITAMATKLARRRNPDY